MNNYTVNELQDRFKVLGYKWISFQLIGIRAKDYAPNTFCDKFIFINSGRVYRFDSTTRPGSYYLLHLLNPKGAAVLKPGQYLDSWTLGLHKNEYLAWVQTKPVTVFRDNNLNDSAEEVGFEDTGLFGIDIHRSNQFSISKLVDKYSAGCQVFADPFQFNSFIDICKGSGLKSFSYTLLEEF